MNEDHKREILALNERFRQISTAIYADIRQKTNSISFEPVRRAIEEAMYSYRIRPTCKIYEQLRENILK